MENEILQQILGELKDIKQGQVRLEKRFDVLEQRFDVLEQRFDVLEQRVGSLEQSVETLKTDVQQIKTDVQQIKTDVQQLKTDIIEIKEQQKQDSESIDLGLAHTKTINDNLNKVIRVTKDNMYDIALLKMAQ